VALEGAVRQYGRLF